jgi:hypothetical protein
MLRIKNIVAAAALGLAVATAYANTDVKEIPLKDGTTLLIFKDGKMSHRDAKGRVVNMKEGTRMVAKDGTVFVMIGNEVFRKTEIEEIYRGGN